MWDHDFSIISDDLIGETMVDLTDRWFDKRWQSLGKQEIQTQTASFPQTDAVIDEEKEDEEEKDSAEDDDDDSDQESSEDEQDYVISIPEQSAAIVDMKPIEHRPLYTTTSATEQGQITMWVEILDGPTVRTEFQLWQS